MPCIDMQGYTVLFAQVPQDGLLTGFRWIFAQCPHAAVGVAANEMIGVKFYDGGCDHIEELLYSDILLRRVLWFGSSCH